MVLNKDEVVVNTPREKWGNKVECVLSLIGLSVGLGNIWKFPAMAYNNGGGILFS
jgi:neurotransmitter:Na+ symporter, NSS family